MASREQECNVCEEYCGSLFTFTGPVHFLNLPAAVTWKWKAGLAQSGFSTTNSVLLKSCLFQTAFNYSPTQFLLLPLSHLQALSTCPKAFSPTEWAKSFLHHSPWNWFWVSLKCLSDYLAKDWESIVNRQSICFDCVQAFLRSLIGFLLLFFLHWYFLLLS